MTLEEIQAKPSKMDRAKVEATTEADIRLQMVEDGEDPEAALREQDIISPAVIRKKLGMSQPEFANTLGIPVATLRNWEQNRVMMDPAVISLMRIMAHEPKAAMRALRR
jgi:putative transcriptional regulator